MSVTLNGARVVLTRAQDDLDALAEAVRARGGEPLPLPCLSFAAPTDPAPLAALLEKLSRAERPDALALASPQAARRLVAALRERGQEPAAVLNGVRLCASGETTARLLASLGLPGALASATGAGAQALVEALLAEWSRAGTAPASRRVWLLKAEEGNPELPRLLSASGAALEQAALYRTVPAGPDDLTTLSPEAKATVQALRAGLAEALVFGSGSAARGFVGLFGAEAPGLAAQVLVAAMGEKCNTDCRALGLPVALVGAGGFDELLAGLAERLTGRRR